MKIKLILAAILVLFACNRPSLLGEWVQPIPGMEDQLQGIKLSPKGVASSINMSTLLYQTWQQEGNKLILTGQSLGNGQTIDFKEYFNIVVLNNQELVLQDGNIRLEYTRALK